MKVGIERLIKHLTTQLRVADKLDSDWVYITRREAEKCLELAEAEDVIMEMLNERKAEDDPTFDDWTKGEGR